MRLDVDPGSGEGFLIGDAVNTAARLQAAAPPGGVVVGERTHSLANRVVVFEQLAPVSAKGKAAPIRMWRAVAPAGRTGMRTAGTTSTALLGRDDDLAILDEELRHASRTRHSRSVLVEGEPGIGKSRLVLEFARLLDGRPEIVTWRQGRCLPFGEGVGLRALGEIVKAHAGILDSDDAVTAEAKLEATLPEGGDRAWLRQRLRPVFGLEASHATRDENVAAWMRFVELIAASGPTVLVLEDLHWAGETMLAFVERLVSRDLSVPLLIVATTRPELPQQRFEGLAAAGGGRLHRMRLQALPRRETGALLAGLLGGELTADSEARVAALVGGNPLYAEQYARLLLDGRFVASGPDGLSLVTDVDIPLPGTVQAVLSARLDTLPAEHKALLCDAAVVGETFWRGGVMTLSGRDTRTVGTGLSALAGRDLIRLARGTTLHGETEYLFWHALVRDVAYAQLPRKTRARKHEAAARWIEVQAGERDDEVVEILVHHYTIALDLARSVGDTALAARLAAPTVAALARAGERALRLDVAAAERHFARALELVATDTSERFRLLPRWGQALLLRNRFQEAANAFREAIPGLKATGQIRAAATAMCWLANVLPCLGEPPSALMKSAVDLLADDGPSPELAEVLGHYALNLHMQDEDPDSVIAVADRAIEMSSVLGLPEPVMAVSCRGLARLNLGDLGGLGDNRRAAAAAQAQGLGIERVTVEINNSYPVLLTEGVAAERAALDEGLAFARRHGLEIHVVSYLLAVTENLRASGAWDEALSRASDLMSLLEQVENVWDILNLQSIEAFIHAARGEPGEAAAYVTSLAQKGGESEVGWTRALCLIAAAAVRLRLGEVSGSLELLSDCFATPRAPASVVELIPEAVRIALAGGDVALAARIVETTESALPSRRLPYQRHAIATLSGLLDEARREYGSAAAGLAAAASGWKELGVPYEEAQALLGQGALPGRARQRAGGRGALAAAREIFARLGARPALEETAAALTTAHL